MGVKRRKVPRGKTRKYLVASAHQASTRIVPAGEFEPNRNQIAVLVAAICNPKKANRKRELAKECKLSVECLQLWWAGPAFRAWWNEQLKGAARDHIGPALMELVSIVEDPKGKASDKIRASETFSKLVEQQGYTAGSGVLVLLEKLWSMDLGGAQARVVTDGKTLAAEFRQSVNGGSDNGDYVSPNPIAGLVPPPPGAVQLPPELQELADANAREYIRAGAEAIPDSADVVEIQTQSRDPRRPMRRPGLVALPKLLEAVGEGGSEKTPTSPQTQRDPPTPSGEIRVHDFRPSAQSHLDDALRRAES